MPVVAALAIVSCLYAPLVCFNIAIRTVKNIFFAYCFFMFVCVNRARFIYASKKFIKTIVDNVFLYGKLNPPKRHNAKKLKKGRIMKASFMKIKPSTFVVRTGEKARARAQFEYMGYGRNGRIIGADVVVQYSFDRTPFGATIKQKMVEGRANCVRLAKARARALRRVTAQAS